MSKQTNYSKRKLKEVTEKAEFSLTEEPMEKKEKLRLTSESVTLHEVKRNKEYLILTIEYDLDSGVARINKEKTVTVKNGFHVAFFKYKTILAEKYLK
jgi:hypothetical protein